MERLKAALFSTIGGTPPPPEYQEFLMCKAFHRLPHDFDEMDEDTYVLFAGMLSVEIEAARLRSIPSAHA